MDRMPGWAFRIMASLFRVTDLFRSPAHRLDPFDIRAGHTVIDYGSGTGRYLPQASALAGENGKVYAVDIQELAIRSAFRTISRFGLKNVIPVLTDGSSVDIPSGSADVILCLDMFHMVSNPSLFLKELKRLARPGGILYLENGHQPRATAIEKVLQSGCWKIVSETKEYLTCTPLDKTKSL